MDRVVIDDLKQFITATIAHSTQELTTRMDGMEAHFDEQLTDLRLILESVADAHSEQLVDHDRRITRLEQHQA